MSAAGVWGALPGRSAIWLLNKTTPPEIDAVTQLFHHPEVGCRCCRSTPGTITHYLWRCASAFISMAGGHAGTLAIALWMLSLLNQAQASAAKPLTSRVHQQFFAAWRHHLSPISTAQQRC